MANKFPIKIDQPPTKSDVKKLSIISEDEIDSHCSIKDLSKKFQITRLDVVKYLRDYNQVPIGKMPKNKTPDGKVTRGYHSLAYNKKDTEEAIRAALKKR